MTLFAYNKKRISNALNLFFPIAQVNFNPPDDYQIMKTDQVVFMADNMQCIKLESSVPYTSGACGFE